MKDASKIIKFLKEYLQSSTHEIDGFVYQFQNVKLDNDFMSTIKFVVNVILPNPNQSYVVSVFDEKIQKIVFDAFDFIGERYSYSFEIKVDGKDLNSSNYVRIKKSSLENIVKEINQKYARIGISFAINDEYEKELEMSCKFFFNQNFPYEFIDPNVNFNMNLYLSDFTINGKTVIPNPEKRNIVAGTLYDILMDRDWFTPSIEEIIYREIEPDVRIVNSDIYFQLSIQVKKLDGFPVSQEERYYKIQIDDFIEVS